jgi:hypothetical protein
VLSPSKVAEEAIDAEETAGTAMGGNKPRNFRRE